MLIIEKQALSIDFFSKENSFFCNYSHLFQDKIVNLHLSYCEHQ